MNNFIKLTLKAFFIKTVYDVTDVNVGIIRSFIIL